LQGNSRLPQNREGAVGKDRRIIKAEHAYPLVAQLKFGLDFGESYQEPTQFMSRKYYEIQINLIRRRPCRHILAPGALPIQAQSAFWAVSG
jgi:hypothetical protein